MACAAIGKVAAPEQDGAAVDGQQQQPDDDRLLREQAEVQKRQQRGERDRRHECEDIAALLDRRTGPRENDGDDGRAADAGGALNEAAGHAGANEDGASDLLLELPTAHEHRHHEDDERRDHHLHERGAHAHQDPSAERRAEQDGERDRRHDRALGRADGIGQELQQRWNADDAHGGDGEAGLIGETEHGNGDQRGAEADKAAHERCQAHGDKTHVERHPEEFRHVVPPGPCAIGVHDGGVRARWPAPPRKGGAPGMHEGAERCSRACSIKIGSQSPPPCGEGLGVGGIPAAGVLQSPLLASPTRGED